MVLVILGKNTFIQCLSIDSNNDIFLGAGVSEKLIHGNQYFNAAVANAVPTATLNLNLFQIQLLPKKL